MEKRKQKMSAFTKFLNKYATWKSVLILLALDMIFNILIFPMLMAKSPNTLPLDLYFSYSSDEVYNLFANFSPAELKTYMITELTVDIVYPIVYSLLFAFVIFKLSGKAIFSMVPILVMFLDYLENIGIVTMIHYYPHQLNSVATITSIFTSLKWILVIVSVALILIFLVKKLINRKTTH